MDPQPHPRADRGEAPVHYYSGDLNVYVSGWQPSVSFYSKDGIMPKDGPITQYKVLAAFQPDLPGKHVDLKKTHTNQFVVRALKTKAPAAK